MAKTQYIYDGFQYLGEADENGTVTKLYVNEPDTYTNLIGEYDVKTDEARFHHYDALGSTTEVTDDAGDVTDTFDYDAWGNVLSRAGANEIPFQCVGERGYYYDDDIKTYFTMFRAYSPITMRWTTIDPISIVLGSWNIYTYVDNNPSLRFDPSGLIGLIAASDPLDWYPSPVDI